MTTFSLVVTVGVLTSLLIVLIIAALSRHKKSSLRPFSLIGQTGVIEGNLDPEGAVIINGELWRACTRSAIELKARNRIRVIGTQAHLLVVEPFTEGA
jgi:membrane protein implicated in regulation of membrane protease activity